MTVSLANPNIHLPNSLLEDQSQSCDTDDQPRLDGCLYLLLLICIGKTTIHSFPLHLTELQNFERSLCQVQTEYQLKDATALDWTLLECSIYQRLLFQMESIPLVEGC